jgi:hypothetical protein
MNDHTLTAARVRPELLALLAEAAGAPPDWAERITPGSRLDADLLLDECELAHLATLLRQRFGERADLAGLRAGLGLDALEALTVGDLERDLLPPHADAPAGGPR